MLRFAIAGSLLLASPAVAHTGDGVAIGFFAGLGHPFSGLDHLLAMVAVGLWAVQTGGRALFILPVAFPVAMAFGGAAGAAGMALPGAELGVATSVLVLGLLIGLAIRLPLLGAAVLVGAFAILHGHAHGAELPEAADALAFGAGFIVATAALHLIGVALGLAIKAPFGARLVRAGGTAIAVAGGMLVSML
jgi:urease accessory protein